MAQQEGEARAVEEGMIREAGERRAGVQMEEMDATLTFGSQSSFGDMGYGGSQTQGNEDDGPGDGWVLNRELMQFESQSSGRGCGRRGSWGGRGGEGGG